MAVLSAPAEVCDPSAPPPTGRLLRLSRRGELAQTIELADGKCTIGSSPRCQVCLPASDARPMQCLLTLEADVATVTRWAAGVLLNGREFATAPLAAGDRLSIGPWEIALAPVEIERAAHGKAETAVAAPTESVAAPDSPPPDVAPSAPEVVVADVPAESKPPAGRETIEFAAATEPAKPAEPTKLPEVIESASIVGSSQLRQVEEALAELMAEASAPAPTLAERPGSKTIHMASRKTSPVVALAPLRPSNAASQTFADRLLVQLWTANRQSRTRCQALVGATRASRTELVQAAAAEAAAKADLTQVRAAYNDDLAGWTSNIATLQSELADRAAQQSRLELELAAYAERESANADAADQIAELTRQHAVAQETLAQLRDELAERDQRLKDLSGERNSGDEIRSELQAQLRREQTRSEELQAHIERLQSDHAAASEAAAAELSGLQAALTAFEAAAAEPAHSLPASEAEYESVEDSTPQHWSIPPAAEAEASTPDAWTLAVEPAEETDSESDDDLPVVAATDDADWFGRWQAQPAEPEAEPREESTATAPTYFAALPASESAATAAESSYDESSYASEPSASSFGFLEAPLEESVDEPIDEPVDEPIDEVPTTRSRSFGDELTPGLSVESPEPAYSPTSFIDRYRDLLDDAPETGSPRASCPARALLDEEHLSPAQARTGDDPEDDADEALEAYMSNLMRRVRGDSGPGASAGMAARSTSLTPGLVSAPAVSAAPVEAAVPEEPLDLEALKAARRQTTRPLDLAALREIANDSARIAIAEHKERRHVESVMNRGILFATTAGAAGYALYMAPNVDSPWFWAGAAAAFAAGGLGIQLLMLLRRRLAMQGRRLNPLAAVATPVDFSALEAPIDLPVQQS